MFVMEGWKSYKIFGKKFKRKLGYSEVIETAHAMGEIIRKKSVQLFQAVV